MYRWASPAFGLFLMSLAFVATPTSSEAQTIGQLDPTPLSRPQELCRKSTAQPTQARNRVIEILKENKFIDQQMPDSQTIDATRGDPAKPDAYDRVLIWMERDFDRPNEVVRVFFLYGRFERVKMATEPISRIKVSETDGKIFVGALQRALVTFCAEQ